MPRAHRRRLCLNQKNSTLIPHSHNYAKNILTTIAAAIVATTLSTSFASGPDEGNCYVYKNGRVVKTLPLSEVGSFTRDDNNALSIWHVSSWNNTSDPTKVIYESAMSDIDSISFFPAAPRADLLDVVFNADGSATDVSPMAHKVIASSETPAIHYNADLGANVACFHNVYPRNMVNTYAPKQYYKIDYSVKPEFVEALKKGHTLEALVKPTHDGNLSDLYKAPNKSKLEGKFFSGHQGGGTGFMITDIDKDNTFCFLPNVSTDGKSNWIWTQDSSSPSTRTYYHLIGVWDKDAGLAKFYINGKLVATSNAAGELKMPGSNVTTFCIGCDAAPDNDVEDGFDGEIAIARIYSMPLNETEISLLWDKARYTVERSMGMPKADMLDVVWTPFTDDTYDASGNFATIARSTGTNGKSAYNPTFDVQYGRFSNKWGGDASDTGAMWHRVDYGKETGAWWKKLAAGHSLEVLVKPDYSTYGTIGTAEVKPFASHQSGGTGLLVRKDNNNTFTFLPHVGGNYKWCASSVTPQSGLFYHVVGVWDKAAGKAHIYVNGKLEATVDAAGELKYPTSGANMFAVGGDPGNINGNALNMQSLWRGDIAIARVYSKALNATQVDRLWREVQSGVEQTASLVNLDQVLVEVQVKDGVRYPIYATGWQSGDKLRLVNGSTTYTLDVTPEAERGVVTLPAGIASGKWALTAMRGDKIQPLGNATFTRVNKLNAGCQVVCHRCLHNTGAPENSRAALKAALEGDYWGAEIDIYTSTDIAAYVYHNDKFSGESDNHYNTTWNQVRKHTLSNGETIPALNDMFEILKNSPNKNMKLVIEIKNQNNDKISIDYAVNSLNTKYPELKDRVEFISFVYGACTYAKTKNIYPVAYLGKDKSWNTLKAAKISLDLKPGQMIDLGINPQTVRNAGLTTNVWTINTNTEIAEMNAIGYDRITTDYPQMAQRYYRYYQDNQ